MLNREVINMTIDISKGLLVGVIIGLLFTPVLTAHLTLIMVATLVIATGVVSLKK